MSRIEVRDKESRLVSPWEECWLCGHPYGAHKGDWTEACLVEHCDCVGFRFDGSAQ